MSEISLDALELLDFLGDSKYPLKSQEAGRLGQKLIEAGYARICMHVRPGYVSLFPLVPLIFAILGKPINEYEYSLIITPRGRDYLNMHRGELEELAERI